MLTRTTFAVLLAASNLAYAQVMPRAQYIGGTTFSHNPRISKPQPQPTRSSAQQQSISNKQQQILNATKDIRNFIGQIRDANQRQNRTPMMPRSTYIGGQQGRATHQSKSYPPYGHYWTRPTQGASPRPVATHTIAGVQPLTRPPYFYDYRRPVVKTPAAVETKTTSYAHWNAKPTYPKCPTNIIAVVKPPVVTPVPTFKECPPSTIVLTKPPQPKKKVQTLTIAVDRKCGTMKTPVNFVTTVLPEPEEIDGLFDKEEPCIAPIAPSNDGLATACRANLLSIGFDTCDRLALNEVEKINRCLLVAACEIIRVRFDGEGNVWQVVRKACHENDTKGKLAFLAKHGAALQRLSNGSMAVEFISLSGKLDKFAALIEAHKLDGAVLAKHGNKLLNRVKETLAENNPEGKFQQGAEVVACVERIIGLGNLKQAVSQAMNASSCDLPVVIADLAEVIDCANLAPCTLSQLLGLPVYATQPVQGLATTNNSPSVWITNPHDTNCDVRYLIDGTEDSLLKPGYQSIHEGATKISFDDGVGRQVDYQLRDARYTWELKNRKWDLKKQPARVVIDNRGMLTPIHVLIDGEPHTIAAGATVEFKSAKPMHFEFDNGKESTGKTLDTGDYQFGVHAATGTLDLFSQVAGQASLPEPEEA